MNRTLVTTTTLLFAGALLAQTPAATDTPTEGTPTEGTPTTKAKPPTEEPKNPATSACAEAIGDHLPDTLESMNVPRGKIRRAQTSMGTTLSLGASGVACEAATKAFLEVFAEFDRLERLTSTRDAGAGLAKINAAAGKEPVVVSRELFTLVELALGFAEITGGAFDPTFAAMDGVWAFDAAQAVPSPEVVAERRKLVDYRKVKLDSKAASVFLEVGGMKLSLGGIAKGYATDQAVAILRRHGLKDFIIRSEGEVFIEGNPGGGNPKLGVPDPRGDGSFALVKVANRALNISRDMKRSFVKDGARYHHIIDPRTGYPANEVRTVALLAPDATAADALSTAVFVLGPKLGMKLVENRRGIEAIVVDDKSGVHLSSGLGAETEVKAPTPVSP